MAKVNLPPAWQMYPKDWLTDIQNSLLTPAEEGARIRLKCHAWLDPDCTLPDDDASLALLSRLGEGWFNGGGDKLRACFVPHPKKPGRLCDIHLMAERKKQDAWRKKSQEGGKSSAESRALRSKEQLRVVEGSLKGGSKMVEPNGNSSSSSSSSDYKNKKVATSSSRDKGADRKTQRPKGVVL